MKLNKIQILIIILLFHLNLNESIEIQNFGKYNLKSGSILGGTTTIFKYQFKPNTSPKYEGLPYFFFGFFGSSSNVLYIYEEYIGEEYTIEIKKNKYFYGYKIQNVTSQQFTFKIYSSRGGDLVIFIDNTKEIDTNLLDFLNFNFSTATSYSGSSFPLIFNINSIAKSTVKFSYNYGGSNYLLEYCKLDGNQCNYKGINNIAFFEKGQNYKIKYKCNKKNSDNFEFNSFSSLNTYEIEFSNFYFYELNSNHEEEYFLLKIKN